MRQTIETLESRRLLAADVALVDGTLEITGTDGPDSVIVTRGHELSDERSIVRGATSVSLDTELLAAAASLELTGADGTARPRGGLDVAFRIDRGSDFTFSTADSFAPVGGTISHSGTVTFNDSVTVGDFEIGFDPSRSGSGFFVADTVAGLGILFDVGAPDGLDAGRRLTIGPADLLVSPEFAGFLLDNGLAESDMTGADVGDARIDALTRAERIEVIRVADGGDFFGDAATFPEDDVDALTADLGDGDDYLSIIGLDIAGPLDIDTGDGNDTLVVFRTSAGGESVFGLGGGDDVAYLIFNDLDGTADGGDGEDTLFAIRSGVESDNFERGFGL